VFQCVDEVNSDTRPMPGSTWQGNWKGRPSLTAYRTHGGQPFHYVLRMYDERGRLASMVRYTENVGFDGVYYACKAMNKIVSVHVIDPSKQHATWYTYDASGRVSSMATRSNDAGYGNGAGSPGPNAVHNIPTMPVLLTPPPTRDISYTYDTRDAVSQTTYSDLGKKTVYTRNKAGWLMENKTTNTAGSTTYHHQRFVYDNLSRITDQYWQNELLNRVETYTYDGTSRLNTWMRTVIGAGADYLEAYGYDRSGNRMQKTRTTAAGTSTDVYGYANAALYQRANWLTGTTRSAGLARTDANTYTENGGIATRTRSEDLLVNTTPFGRQTYETWDYDANNLVERYTRASVVKSQNLATGCYPDALTAPRDDWRYRYAPFMEREQKRQFELSSGEYMREGLAWVYYGLGGDKKQLSVWNGVQGTWCLQNNHVFLWPVEYNSYGPMNTRIITRSDGAKETAFTDHLGSTVQVRQGTPEFAADQRAYTAFGESLEVPADPLIGRTGYIGRETDNESDLGFYGVRQYDAGYGRFLSTDPMWHEFPDLTPYNYSANDPIGQSDPTGLSPDGEVDSPTWQIVKGSLSVVSGAVGIVISVPLLAAPTGVSQVAGVGLASVSFGSIALGSATVVDGISAAFQDQPVHDIPQSYGELAGKEIDKGLGGDGTIGGITGGVMQGMITGAGGTQATKLLPTMVGSTNIAVTQFGLQGALAVDGMSSGVQAGMDFYAVGTTTVVKPSVVKVVVKPEVRNQPMDATTSHNDKTGGGLIAPMLQEALP